MKKTDGNGMEDTALLYVCYKKQGKAYNTYCTTELDQQEFNYIIEEIDNKIYFTVTEEKYIESFDEFATVPILRQGTLEDLKKLIQEELDRIERMRNER